MKYNLSKRTLALLLSIVMIVTMLPAVKTTAAMVQENSQVVDGNTMDSWQSFFHPTDITTAHAGGVWTDKSVFMNSPFDSDAIRIDKANNFLVALSALGSNSIVIGQDYAPTDTMFVLDVSNSMSSNALTSMVTATNNAIGNLLAGENNTNRVGVVLYGTTASVLLPLDRYTGVNIGGVETFIQLNGSSIRAAQNSVWVPAEGGDDSGNWWDEFWESIFGGGDQGDGEYVTTYLTNSAGNNVTTSVSTGGGTYTQGGIWKAWQQFNAATAVSTDKVSARRAPVMVLMCDGAATYSASAFNNVPDSATHGTGSASSTGDGFVTQLTAAYVKAKMTQKYGTAPFFYTLGLDAEDIAIAQAILDPANKTAATDIDEEWADFLQGSATVSMYRRSQGGSNQNVTIQNNTDVSFNADSYKYADKYFSATQISDLNQQFQNIVNEISLSAGYYPTHLDDNGANYSGYITFVDELGKGMEVKEVEGLVIGDNTYTGRILARALVSGFFGTKQEPTAMGDEFVRAVKARLGLTDNNEVWALLDYSYNIRKSLHYTSDSDWSNYIVWYGDANGEYLGYDESLESIAAYRNECYGMLGAPDGTHQTTDMMYVGIQVSTNLATGDQTVTFRVPAAMLPVVTYQITIDGNEVTEDTSATLSYHAADPIRLVYEVGVKDEITALNVKDYAQQIDGKFYLFTNKWNQDPDLTSTATNNLTYAYFEPGADNEHYYFTEDSVIYTDINKSGTVASAGALNVDGNYYYEHYVFNQPTRNSDGTFTVKADFHMEKLSTEAVTEAKSKAIIVDGKLCVPEGTMHYAHSHDLFKGAEDSSATAATANNTGTFPYVRDQIVDARLSGQDTATGAKHYELVYMGNNGRLTVEPATGISITKLVDATITDADATYTFEITFEGVNVPNGTYNGVQVSGNQATVSLKAGETVHIYNLPVGARYHIEEKYGDGYRQSAAVGADGTVIGNAMQEAIFTNTKRGTGTLTIEKDVIDHPFTTDEIEQVDFNFEVELKKADGTPYSGNISAIKSGHSSTTLNFVGGKASFTLHDNQELSIINLPEGTTYIVREVDADGQPVAINGTPKPGYKLVSVAGQTSTNTVIGTLAANEVKYAHFVNEYVATPITPTVEVAITKNVIGVSAPEEAFTFRIEQVLPASNWTQTITTGTGSANATKVLNGLSFSSVGTYSFLVHELTPTQNKTSGMTYDAKRASFNIVVTDNDRNGTLEWSIADVVNATKSDDDTVAVEFNNIYEVGSVTATFHAKKVLTNTTGVHIPLTDFQFGLYMDAACTIPAFDGSDVMNPRSVFTAGPGGLVDIKVHINRAMIGGEPSAELVYYLKEIVPADTKLGMTYDTTVYKVTISVIDNGDLSASVNVAPVPASGNSVADGTTAVFNNTYALESVNVSLSGEKTLEGRNWLSGETFTAELYNTDATFHVHEDDVPIGRMGMTEGQKYTFDLGNFSKVGIYHYVVKEQIPVDAQQNALNGITYDATEYHVTITVTPSAEEARLLAGVTVLKLGGNAVAPNELDFKNVYAAAATDEVPLGGIKSFMNMTPGVAEENRVLYLQGGEFTFQLVVKDEAGETVATDSATNKLDGSFSFAPISFTKAGVYTATITEVNGGLAYIGYAEAQTVTITVSDNNAGKLIASIDKIPSDVKMVNTYTAAETKLGLVGFKELVGAEGTDRPLQAGDFSFTLKPIANPLQPSVTVKNDATGKFTFPDITFDAVGTYQYTITEEKEADGTNGIYYDKAVYTVTVDVADNGAGKLVASVTAIVAEEGLADETVKHVIDFYNSYYAKPAQVILTGNKVLENVTPGIAAEDKNIPLTGENLTKFPFNFVLEAVTEGAPMPNQAMVASGENGAIVFGAITFDKMGQYKYTVKEIIPANSTNGVLNGVTYTAQTHNITITVTDDKLGQLVASVALEGSDKAFEADGKTAKILSFKNTYKADTPETPGSVVFAGTKVLENITEGIAAADKNMSLANKRFQFQLKDASGKVIETVTNGADGAFAFKPLAFHTLGEYTYTITEVAGDKGYILYATQPVTVKVSVTDADLDGLLEIGVTYDGAAKLTITNKYTAEATKLALTGTKKLDTRNPRDGEFEFVLACVNGAPMPDAADKVTVKNDASGNILFPEITYKAVGEYKYTIQEVTTADGEKGVTYDKTVYDVTVTVTDGGEGELIASVKSVKQGETEKADVVFLNKYQAAPVSVSFNGIKTLIGRQLQDGEFSFVLTDAAGTILDTVKNKDGKFIFVEQKLLTAGTYKFLIKEDASAGAEGITYDKAVYEITVEVTDDGYGQLSAAVTVVKDGKAHEGEVAFVNHYNYDAPPATGDATRLTELYLGMGISGIALLAVLVLSKKKFSVQ